MRNNHFTLPPEGLKELIETVENHGSRLAKIESVLSAANPAASTGPAAQELRDIRRTLDIVVSAVSEIRRKEMRDQVRALAPSSKTTQLQHLKGHNE